MRHELASRLVVGEDTSVSPAVDMGQDNAVLVDVVCISGSFVTVGLEESNDGENWSPVGITFDVAVGTYATEEYPKTGLISSRMVRLTYFTEEATVISAGLNTANL